MRLPMILFVPNSHGYKMLKSSFDYLWRHMTLLKSMRQHNISNSDTRQSLCEVVAFEGRIYFIGYLWIDLVPSRGLIICR